MKIPIYLAVAALFTGCVSSQTMTGSHAPHIPAGAVVAIHQPADGVYDGESYANSGATVARKLKAALIRYFPACEISQRAAAYTIKPTILRWEDRATEWSGKPDRLSISLQCYDRAGVLVGSATIDAKSSWWTLGGDHPEDLLEKPFDEYALALASQKQ